MLQDGFMVNINFKSNYLLFLSPFFLKYNNLFILFWFLVFREKEVV